VVVVLVAGCTLAAHAAQAPPATFHPLDPLTREEIVSTADILRAAGRVAEGTRFASIDVNEPPKAEILAFRSGIAARREAFVVLYNWADNRTSEAVVDLRGRKVLSWKDVPGVQPPLIPEDDHARTDRILRADPRWVEAMRRRGIQDLNGVVIAGYPPGGYGPQPPDGDRRAIAMTFYRDFPPISLEGLTVLVNLTKGQVERFEDSGANPPRPNADVFYDPGRPRPMRAAPKPLRITQPQGPGFEIRGNEVRWEGWRFRFGMHPREGLVLHTVGFEERGVVRSVLYRASLAELVVPYGDPGWMFWNPFDVGEEGFGRYGRSPLTPGADAQENASFFNATMHDSFGRPIEVPRAVALYERDGGVLWRHGDDSRRARDLVLTSFATIDNYDYGFNWIFHQDGSLEVDVQMTGIMLFKPVETVRETGDHGDRATFGHLVAPNVVAPHHQHFFHFRLDLDVDGARPNQVVEMDTVGLPPGEGNPNRNGFMMKETLLRTDTGAKRVLNLQTSRRWKVENPDVKNALGQPTAYMLFPGENALPFAPADSFLRKKAGFVEAHLWATPYAPRERYPAGDYVNQGPLGDGLPRWTQAGRSLEREDVVLWYTLGVTHLPRPEDWPVMPVHHAGFKLLPLGFFARNPVLDAARPR
jgi:primary-amine oxidase